MTGSSAQKSEIAIELGAKQGWRVAHARATAMETSEVRKISRFAMLPDPRFDHGLQACILRMFFLQLAEDLQMTTLERMECSPEPDENISTRAPRKKEREC